MKKNTDLSPAEFEVMDIIWQRGTATVKQIQADLEPNRKLAITTICTLVSRMKAKGYVESIVRGMAYEYHPLVTRDRVVQKKLVNFVDCILNGDMTLIIEYLMEHSELTPDQCKALSSIRS